jgi:DNA-binding CsgD family transcriptional regulator
MKDLNLLKEDENSVLLNEKEVQMLQLTADGLTTKEVAVKMNLGVRTLDNYKSSIIQRAEANNILQVIIALYKKGIIV